MAEFDSEPLLEPPVMGLPLWNGTLDESLEDMFNVLLGKSDAAAVGAGEEDSASPFDGGAFLGFDGSFVDVIGLEDDQLSGLWRHSAAPVDAVLDQINYSALSDAFFQETGSLPGLSSEVSSLGDDIVPVLDNAKTSMDAVEIGHDTGVSSPGSCSRAEADCRTSANSDDDVGILSSRSVSPIVTNCSDLKTVSPDTGCDSSDVGAVGRSCDNFEDLSERQDNSPASDIDEVSKRQSRLMRNRESATQSRLRKKSYVKDLEAKCRAMESQLTMLQQTVAFTSFQNAALREELAHVKSLKGNGSKFGATEPAVLPSYSLPSEYPSRHTFPCLSVKWELVAFLCHVLLLTLFQALPLKVAASGENNRSEVRSEGRFATLGGHLIQHVDSVTSKSIKGCSCSSRRWKKRILSRIGDFSFNPQRSLILTVSPKQGHRSLKFKSRHCKSSDNRCFVRFRRKSQYNSLPFLRSSRAL